MSTCRDPIYDITCLPRVIPVGIRTEKGAAEVRFDVSIWKDKWPDMYFEVWATRPNEDTSYPVESVMEGDLLTWTVSAADTEIEGLGTVEVVGMTPEGVRKLSGPITTAVRATSINQPGEVPESHAQYYEALMLSNAQTQKITKENATAAAQSAQEATHAASAAGQHSANADAQAASAAQSAASAGASEQAAGESAAIAEKSKQDAIKQAADAEKSAKDAETSAANAADSATSAYQSFRSASSAASAAHQYADSAADAAYDAQSARQEAQEKAGAAAQSATSAAQSSSLANASAKEAETRSENAAAYAQAASESADAASKSQFNAESYAADAGNKAQAAAESAEKAAESAKAATAAIPGVSDPLKQLVTDENGKVLWEDRLAYKINHKESVTNLEEQALDWGQLGEPFGLLNPWAVDMESGKTYNVAYNGTVYNLLAVVPPTDGEFGPAVCALGDTACVGLDWGDVEGSDPNAPFGMICHTNAIGATNSGVYGELFAKDGASAVTLEITHEQERTYKKTIAPELLPEGAGGTGMPETSAPHQQLVTDADGKVGWEERLAYKYTAEGEIVHLAATEITGVEDDGALMFPLLSPWSAELTAGIVHTVVYNGTAYECKAIPYSDVYPESSGVPDGLFTLGNTSLLGIEGVEGSNPATPFVLMTYTNAMGAEEGIYGALLTNDGATAITLSVTSKQTQTIIKTIDPELIEHRKITLTVDTEGNVTSDTDFATAWAMDAAALQAAITVKAEGLSYSLGKMSYNCAPVGVNKSVIADGMLKMITVRYKTDVDYSDYNGSRAETRMIEWVSDGIGLSKYTVSEVPTNLVANTTYYLRWNNRWNAVTIDQLKADLGLN